MFKKTLKTCSPFSLHVSVSKIIAIVYLIRNLLLYLYSLSYSLTSSLDSGLMYFPLSLNVACIVIPTWFFSLSSLFLPEKANNLINVQLQCHLVSHAFFPWLCSTLGKSMAPSVHIVLDSYVCLLLWKNVIWLCYLITTFVSPASMTVSTLRSGLVLNQS